MAVFQVVRTLRPAWLFYFTIVIARLVKGNGRNIRARIELFVLYCTEQVWVLNNLNLLI